MKRTIIILVLLAVLLVACKVSRESVERARSEASWTAFCAARGYDINDNTFQANNEYLDTWCGSAQEDSALVAAGYKPY